MCDATASDGDHFDNDYPINPCHIKIEVTEPFITNHDEERYQNIKVENSDNSWNEGTGALGLLPTIKEEPCDNLMELLSTIKEEPYEVEEEDDNNNCAMSTSQEGHQHLSKCSTCDKVMKPSSLKLHEMVHKNGRIYECTICNKRFAYSYYLKIHHQMHVGQKKHECEACGKRFRYASSLVAHKQCHLNAPVMECKVCLKTLKVSSYKQHELVHRLGKQYECSVCHKKFAYSYYLKTHMLTHTNERPHVCVKCSKSFKVAQSLKQHCNRCDKLYDNKDNLEHKTD